jgi:hypothetical protein
MYVGSKLYTEVEVMYKETLPLTEEVHGPSRKNTLSAIGDLGEVYMEAKPYTEAEAMHFHLTKGAHGPSHKATLYVMERLAEAFGLSGQYDETEAQGEERLCLTKEAHGYSHANTLEAIRWVGGDALSSL